MAEFSAHERDVPEWLSRKEAQMLGALAHGRQEGTALSSLPAGSATPSFPETQQRLPFKPAPSWLGRLGLRELLISPFVPLCDLRVQT